MDEDCRPVWFPAYAGIGAGLDRPGGYLVATACNLVGMAKLMLNHQGGKTPVVGTEGSAAGSKCA